MSLSQQVGAIGQAFAEGLKRVLGGKLHGAYIYGAAAFPDDLPLGDIDFHVMLTGELTDGERLELERLHASLAERFPPLGGELDGYYILLGDTRLEVPPTSQVGRRARDNAWALHCEHVRAGRCIVLHGPPPMEVYPAASWQEIERALLDELDYVERHLCEYPAYCILNLCRLIYSFETRDIVVSKAQAARWASEVLPDWQRPIATAFKSYARQATQEDREFLLAEVGRLLALAPTRIRRAREDNIEATNGAKE